MADKQDEGLKLLKEIRHITHMIEELQEELDKTYSMLTSTTVKPKEINIQTSGDPDPLATKMATILEYQEQIQTYQANLCEKKKKVISILQLMDIEEQRMLNIRYLKGATIEQVMNEMHRSSYYHMWEALHKAEDHFCNIYAEKY